VSDEVLLEGRDVVKHFPIRSAVLRRVIGQVRAVDGVDVAVPPGKTLGLVGESGSGKSTLGRVLIRLLAPTAGSITFAGDDITRLPERRLRPLRREMAMVFQDPYSSMDPLATVGDSLAEPLRTHLDLSSSMREARIGELLETVRLTPAHRNRYPREFSGGQLQRIAIARALALYPQLLVLDEPVSSLDVSIQADVVNLLKDLQRDLGLAYLFIAHDLAVVRHMSDRIAVMYLGRIVEEGAAAEVYERPKHPYTEALLSAIPVPHPTVQRSRARVVLTGDIPSPAAPPPGCRFHTRCPYVMDVCRSVDPPAFPTPDGSRVHCHLHTEGPRLAGDTVLGLRTPTP
jgi:oligopeptide transport system ATP-binding protein